MIKVKSNDEVPKAPSQYFANLFNAYAKAINKAYDRTGSLFERPFERIEVTDDAYFTQLVAYIHLNPVKHGFADAPDEWPFTSYRALRTTRPTRLRRDVVLDWFGGREGFIAAHEVDVVDLSGLPDLTGLS